MRIKPLVVLSLVCSLSQAADTVASLGDSIKATQFVTAVDHSNITDGTGKVYFVDGVAYEDVVTTTTIVEREPVSVWFYPVVFQPSSYTPPWSSIKVEVDYSSWTNIGSDHIVNYGRRIKDIASPNNYLYVSDYNGNPDPEGECVYTHDPNVDIPYIGELANVYNDDDSPVACMFFMRDAGTIVPFVTQAIYTNYTETAITVLETNSYRVATAVDIPSTNGFASTTWVNNHKWDWATQVTNKSSFVSSLAIGRNGTSYTGDIELVLTHADPNVTLTTNFPSGIKIGSLNYTHGIAELDLFNKGDPNANVDWDTPPITTDIYIPGNVSAFNNDAGYVPASTATNIAKQIIRNAVSGVNTNIQSAEDARVALTNLITILKNL